MRLKGHSGGAAIIQFCLIFPLLALFVAFLLNIAAYVWEMVILVDAAREGARRAVIACETDPSTAYEKGLEAANDYLTNSAKATMSGMSHTETEILGHKFSSWGLETPQSLTEEQKYFVKRIGQQYMQFSFKENGGGVTETLAVPVKFLTLGVPLKQGAQESCYFCLKNNPFLSFAAQLPKTNGQSFEVSQTILTFSGCQ